LQGEVFRELEGRRTLRTEVAGRGYFVKIHRGAGWAEIVKNLFRCACRCSARRTSGRQCSA
jgi:heptose I phosphotransferase